MAPAGALSIALSGTSRRRDTSGLFLRLRRISTYGNKIFLLVYIDPNKDTKDNDNRIFFSDKTWGVTTWAMSKQGFLNYLDAGTFDSGATNTGRKVTDLKPELTRNASAYSVSQYFKMGSKDVHFIREYQTKSLKFVRSCLNFRSCFEIII